MPEAQIEIEDDDIDTTADKAAEIGKELGLEKTKDDLPDYDVVEEDAPIAKEREPRQERKQLTNKEKRDLRKKRNNERFKEKDSIIEAQQQQLQALAARLNDIDGRMTQVDRTKIDQALNQAVYNFQQAEKDHASAFTEGDGAKATASMKIMYAAQREIDKIQGIKQQFNATPQPQQITNAPDPVLVNKAKTWAERQTWYNPDGSDEDSEIAKAISGKLANEGYDPKSDDFWDELDDRLSARGIGEVEDDAPVTPVVRKRTSPPISAGSGRADTNGKIKVSLPTAYINACKDAGYWDDPVKKARMIKRYLDGQKQQGAIN